MSGKAFVLVGVAAHLEDPRVRGAVGGEALDFHLATVDGRGQAVDAFAEQVGGFFVHHDAVDLHPVMADELGLGAARGAGSLMVVAGGENELFLETAVEG